MTDASSNPHDQYFKLSFAQPELAADLVAHYLSPEVVATLDLRVLVRQDGSFVDDDLRAQQSDLLFRAPLLTGGASALLARIRIRSARSSGAAGRGHCRRDSIAGCLTCAPGYSETGLGEAAAPHCSAVARGGGTIYRTWHTESAAPVCGAIWPGHRRAGLAAHSAGGVAGYRG